MISKYLVLMFYFYVLFFIFLFGLIILMYFWIRFVYYLRKNSKYWHDMYTLGLFPNRLAYSVYLGKEDFNDSKIRYYKKKVKLFLIIVFGSWLLAFLSIIILGLIGFSEVNL